VLELDDEELLVEELKVVFPHELVNKAIKLMSMNVDWNFIKGSKIKVS
jgi:hypothetical protein